MLDFLKQPWPWYVAGPLLGLTVPLLLILGNKQFGVSANLRHTCAALFPRNVSFFRYDWKKESWNLLFAAGIIVGGFVSVTLLNSNEPVEVDPRLLAELNSYNITDHAKMLPSELFGLPALETLRGVILLVVGGFLVGFGTRYAGGCTSGHSIMGISSLQIPSVIATISFMVGGLLMANLILPFILKR